MNNKTWNKKRISPEFYHSLILQLVDRIKSSGKKYEAIYAIPRGGLIVGVYLSHYLNLPLFTDVNHLIFAEEILIVDDLADTGSTLEQFSSYDSAVVLYKPRSSVKPTYYAGECNNDDWIIHPFEVYEEIPNRKV